MEKTQATQNTVFYWDYDGRFKPLVSQHYCWCVAHGGGSLEAS